MDGNANLAEERAPARISMKKEYTNHIMNLKTAQRI
jgi:hypothetical protein